MSKKDDLLIDYMDSTRELMSIMMDEAISKDPLFPELEEVQAVRILQELRLYEKLIPQTANNYTITQCVLMALKKWFEWRKTFVKMFIAGRDPDDDSDFELYKWN